MALGKLGQLIFAKHGFSSEAPEDLEWLIEGMLELARECPEQDDVALFRAVMGYQHLGRAKRRYTIDDIHAYAKWRLAILEQAREEYPDLNWPPVDTTDWSKLAQLTEVQLDLALEMSAEPAREETAHV